MKSYRRFKSAFEERTISRNTRNKYHVLRGSISLLMFILLTLFLVVFSNNALLFGLVLVGWFLSGYTFGYSYLSYEVVCIT